MQAFSAQNVGHANRGGGLCKASDILKPQHGDLLVSRHKLRQAEGVSLVREKREAGNQILGFATRPFVLCGLPIRRPPQSDLVYERRNGVFTLQITGHTEFGLPFGQDRLVDGRVLFNALGSNSSEKRRSGMTGIRLRATVPSGLRT
ncbi:MAG: hypothetical protein JWP63_2613 [Candidatus Solibacter sp.]|nr:hypothetical protein [Candidatus Solibacter sp.]